MPHLKIEYTGNLEPKAGMDALCQALAKTLAGQQDGTGKSVFPLNGTRVLAYPAPHHAVAGGEEGNGYVYLNLRIMPGRPKATVEAVGEALLETVKRHFDRHPLGALVGITLHIDEGTQAYAGGTTAY